jgi:hypothetical protein
MPDRPDRPLTFEEAAAVQDPDRIARLTNGESYEDRSVKDTGRREVIVHEECQGNGDWWVEYFDDDGGCYVTIFSGPEREARARDYFHALKSKRLNTIRALMHTSPARNARGVVRRKPRKK